MSALPAWWISGSTTMSMTPFPYQIAAMDGLRDGFRKGHNRGLLCMLMGAGKTKVAMDLMRATSEKGNRSLFVCDRRMLAKQTVERAEAEGLDAGLILSGLGNDTEAKCQFASKQTIESWLKSGRINLPEYALLVIDEVHRAVSKTWVKFRERIKARFEVGLTATPCLGNGSGMGAYYDFLVQPIQPSGLREMDRIVKVRAFAPHVPDLKGVKKDKDGDYSAKSLSERMNRANLIGDVAGWWKKLAQGRPSIYFSCDVAHAMSIRDEFRSQGVSAELICDETPDDERDDIRRRLESGDISIVVNCDVLAEGIDWPFVSCIGLVRPTKRLRRYLQNSGRGMRSHPGKEDCVLIDHAGCVLYHGFPDVDREWPLDANDNIDEKKDKDNQAGSMRCSQCHAVFSGTRKCPECGHEHVITRTPKEYANKQGTLVEVSEGNLDPDTSFILMQRFWATCIGVAIKRRARAGMAAAMFSGKFGIPPWQAKVHPLPSGSGDWKRAAEDVFPGFARR